MIVTSEPIELIDFAPATEVDEVIQNVRTIITTTAFSVPLDRRFGISGEFIDSPLTDNEQALLQEEIFNAIRTYEPRATLNSITFEMDPVDGILKPTLDIEITGGGTT